MYKRKKKQLHKHFLDQNLAFRSFIKKEISWHFFFNKSQGKWDDAAFRFCHLNKKKGDECSIRRLLDSADRGGHAPAGAPVGGLGGGVHGFRHREGRR